MIKTISLFFLIFFVYSSICQTLNDPAYVRYNSCRKSTLQDNQFVANFTESIIPYLNASKGYSGTIGVVGGSHTYTGKPFIAALTALRVGANAVHIFCTNAAGPAIQSMSPNIIVHPFLDTNLVKASDAMLKMDVIVLGPGLDENGYSINAIVKVITLCKTLHKPLIVHLSEYFLTPATINLLKNYPSPGVVLITNSQQFEKIYTLIKHQNALSDVSVQINFESLPNILIMRTGCTVTAVSQSPLTSWSNSDMYIYKKTSRLDEMISGATATYLFWAIQNLQVNENTSHGAMFPAAVATYSASRMLRETNKIAFNEKKMSMTTLDMIDKIHKVLYFKD